MGGFLLLIFFSAACPKVESALLPKGSKGNPRGTRGQLRTERATGDGASIVMGVTEHGRAVRPSHDHPGRMRCQPAGSYEARAQRLYVGACMRSDGTGGKRR